MNKKQIKRFASFLVKKTKGLFHYEEDTWEQFFSKRQVVKYSKKLSICMKDKNYQYFCDCLFNAFDNLYKKRSQIETPQLRGLEVNPQLMRSETKKGERQNDYNKQTFS